jgi:NAD(P)H-hydrate epimerase
VAWPELATDRWARDVLPPFNVSMHKGDRGRVLVVGGDDGMAGAAIHAARSALLAGAGLVRLVAAEPTIRAAQETLPDALTLVSRLGPDPEKALLEAADWADALIVGPGLGRGPDRKAFVTKLLGSTGKPALIDADALHAGAESWGARKGRRVLTPHPGEFAVAFPALAEESELDRFAAAAAAARGSNCVVLLKGVPTVIAEPSGHSFVTVSGNPALATGGSGDVLSGMIGAFLARGLDPLTAAALGSHAMGRAADRAASEHTARASRPGDVLDAVPLLWKRWAEPSAPLTPPILATLPLPQLT